MPVSIPFERALIHTPRLAVFVSGVRAYPKGFEFVVTVRRPRGLGRVAQGPGDHSPFGGYRPPFEEDPDADRYLRFGILFADGRRAAAGRWRPFISDGEGVEPEPPLINTSHGQGGDRHWEQGFWVWGLPDEGPATIVYSWSDEDVPESQFDLDGDVLREAAARATVLWPDEEA